MSFHEKLFALAGLKTIDYNPLHIEQCGDNGQDKGSYSLAGGNVISFRG